MFDLLSPNDDTNEHDHGHDRLFPVPVTETSLSNTVAQYSNITNITMHVKYL